MGIRLLNKLINRHAITGISKKNLSFLRNKKIVIDTNIYLYKYSTFNTLDENIYSLCSLFLEYDITPVFIFDGNKQNDMKQQTLENRKLEREQAQIEYNNLINNTDDITCYENNKKYKELKLKCVKLKREDIEHVKKIIKAFGMICIQAEGEADELCAAFVKDNKAYACLTEDTDLFVCGCPRVIKYINLVTHKIIFCELDKILLDLKLNYSEFLNVSILSGTDYNEQITGNIFYNIDIFYKYTANCQDKMSFLDWMLYKKYLNQDDIKTILEIRKKFDIKERNILSNIPYVLLKKPQPNKELLTYLLDESFIFS